MTAQIWLATSIVVLAVGPCLHSVLRRGGPRIAAGLDGFLLVAVLGLVLIDVLPEAVSSAYRGTLMLRARPETLRRLLPTAPGDRLHGPLWLIDPLGNINLPLIDYGNER